MTGTPRKTLMVSSTALDLGSHRDAVKQACLEAGFFPRMMEHLPASDTEAIEISTQMVDEADLYLGIFAHRYGYVPPNSDRSITEAEYERAVQRGIPRLIFLMHDDYQGLRASDFEMGPNFERLQKFKQRLKTERVVKFFKSPEDLRAQVIASLLPFAQTGTASGAADLTISSLRGARRLTPLDGHPALPARNDSGPILTGGFHVSFTLAHNGMGKHSINLHALELVVDHFEPGPHPDLSYEIEGRELIGAGVARPHVFSLAVFGDQVGRAQWITDGKQGTFVQANSANFFDTDDPRILTFPAGGADIEEIRGTVLMQEPGLYKVRFVFHYSVGGQDQEKSSEAIHVYSDE